MAGDTGQENSGEAHLTTIQQLFVDFIARHVRPVATTIRDVTDAHVAGFAVNPEGQLVPVDQLVLQKFVRVPIDEDSATGGEVPEPHTIWSAKLSNNDLGISTTLELGNDGFTYTTGVDVVEKKVPDELASHILTGMVLAWHAGSLTPQDTKDVKFS